MADIFMCRVRWGCCARLMALTDGADGGRVRRVCFPQVIREVVAGQRMKRRRGL